MGAPPGHHRPGVAFDVQPLIGFGMMTSQGSARLSSPPALTFRVFDPESPWVPPRHFADFSEPFETCTDADAYNP